MNKNLKKILIAIGCLCVYVIMSKCADALQLGVEFNRIFLGALLLAFLIAHIRMGVKALYDFIHEKRVWIAIGLFVFCVLNKYHFSSVGMFNFYVEPGLGTEYISPVLGEPRAIRSDEWLVTLMRQLSAEHTGYGEFNDIVRGTETTNMSATGLYASYSALAKPADWGYYLFGSEYGVAFSWSFKMIFGYLFLYELCLILTKQKRLISLLGATIIWWSSYNMWWSIATWMLTGSAAIVFFYYFMNKEVRWKRLLYGMGIAMAGANFCVELYPAWQVPAGYVYLILLLWVFINAKEKWKAYKALDWGLGIACVGFMGSIIVSYLVNYSEYMTAIMSTEYPGQRVDYGSFSLMKALGYLSATLSSVKEFGNSSEMGCFYIAFPLGIILALIVLWRKRGKHLLIGLLLIPTTLFACYCSFPLPEPLAKYTLMTFSTAARAVDVLGFVSALLLVIALADMQESGLLKWYIGIPIAVICAGLALRSEVLAGRTDIYWYLVLLFSVITLFLIIGLITKTKPVFNTIATVLVIGGILFTGLSVNPLMKGLDVIYSKPVAEKIAEIVEEDSDALWIATDTIANGNYLIALGARTYNSVNYVPNMDLWEELDPEGTYNEVYNRYAHMIVSLTEEETTMSLQQADMMQLNLSKQELDDLDVSYILSVIPMEDDEYLDISELYNANGLYIYKCEY